MCSRSDLWVEKSYHRGSSTHRSDAHIRHIKFTGCNARGDDIGDFSGDALHMRLADIPILFHRDGDHVARRNGR